MRERLLQPRDRLLEEASSPASRPHTPWRPARASLESMQRVQDALGGQTIGFFGSFILIYNQLIGPALLELPKVFAAAGLLPMTVALVVTCIVSSYCVVFLCDVMARIPASVLDSRPASRLADQISSWTDRVRARLSFEEAPVFEPPPFVPAGSRSDEDTLSSLSLMDDEEGQAAVDCDEEVSAITPTMRAPTPPPPPNLISLPEAAPHAMSADSGDSNGRLLRLLLQQPSLAVPGSSIVAPGPSSIVVPGPSIVAPGPSSPSDRAGGRASPDRASPAARGTAKSPPSAPGKASAEGGRRRYEFCDIVGYMCGPAAFRLVIPAFVLCNMSQAISAILATSHVADQLILFSIGRTYAVASAHAGLTSGAAAAYEYATNSWGMPWRVVEWDGAACREAIKLCPGRSAKDLAVCAQWGSHCVPFSQTPQEKAMGVAPPTVLTLGYVLSACAFAPLGNLALDDNIKFQVFSFFLQAILMAEFAFHFLYLSEWPSAESSPRLPLVGHDTSNVLGVSVFNFALAMTIPSWMNEKKAAVSAPATVWPASGLAVATFVVLGALGAAATPNPPDDLLVHLASDEMPTITRLSAFLFGVIIIGLGVPVVCVVVRYNLLVSRLLRPSAAAFCSVLLPWLVSWPLYQGHAALDLISWSGMIFNGFINLILPLLLALAAAGVLWRDVLAPLAPPEASLVRPLPPALEPFRTWLLWALLLVALPAILVATVLKTYEALAP